MWINKPFEHPNDEQLLAYLDGELTKTETREIQQHLSRCWKCRALVADIEAQVEAVSRLLSASTGSDADRCILARQQFMERKSAVEKLRKRTDHLWPLHFGRVAKCAVPTIGHIESVILPA